MTNEEQATWLGEAVHDSLDTAQCLMSVVSGLICRRDVDAGVISEAISFLNGADLALHNARSIAERMEAEGDE